MPWTFSHPAAVLPLRRACPRWLSFPALVVGSVIPDAAYYVDQFDVGRFAHTPWGLLTVSLPTGLAALLLLWWLRHLVPALLPQPHRNIVSAALAPPPRHPGLWLALPGSILIGAATHVFWDSFTHATGTAVLHFAVLRTELFQLGERTHYVFNLLQHLSTAVGLMLLLRAYRRTLTREATTPSVPRDVQDPQRIRLLLWSLATAVVIGIAMAMVGTPTKAGRPDAMLVRAVIHATAAFMMIYLGLAVLWRSLSRGPGREYTT